MIYEFSSFVLPVNPSPTGGGEVSEQLCGCIAVGQGQPTAAGHITICSLCY